ncbi:MAG: hypothetical protein KBH06_12100 [Spirochaetes bacterium]|nr:hypothetical protein [Spirochaetota bacterium]
MKKIIPVFIFLVCISCFGKTNIEGKWKLVEPNIGELYISFSGSNVVEEYPGVYIDSGKYIISKGMITRTYEKYTKTDRIISVSSTEMFLEAVKIEFSSKEEELKWYPDGDIKYGKSKLIMKYVKTK